MSDEEPRRRSAVPARAVGVALLVAVGALLLHPSRPLSGGIDRGGVDAVATVLAGVSGAVAAGLVLVTIRLFSRLRTLPGGDDGVRRPPPPSLLARAVTAAICAALFATPVAVLLARPLPERPHLSQPQPVPSSSARGGASSHGVRRPPPLPQAAAFGAGLLIVAFLAAAAGGRLRFGGRRTADVPTQLSRAISAGAAELDAAGSGADEAADDAREAVIRCYAAMERELAGAGAARRPADTPTELLRRATEGGLVDAEPAQTLTELFQRARFSRAVMVPDDVGAARRALSELQQPTVVSGR